MDSLRLGLTLILSTSFLCGVLVFVYSYKWRSMPGAKYLSLLIFAILVYIGGYIGQINSDQFAAAMFWYDFQYLTIPVIPYLWLMTCLDYTQVFKKIRKSRILLLQPVLSYLVFLTSNFHHLYVSSYSFVSNGYFPVIVSIKGPAYIAVVISTTIIGIACTLIFIRGWLKSTRMYKSSYMLMITSSVCVWLTIYLKINNTSYLGIDYFPVLSIVPGLFYLFGIFQYNIFSTIPIATETVYQKSEDPIALIDIGGRIMDVNQAFVKQYPEFKNMFQKYTLHSFQIYHPELNRLSSENPKLIFETEVEGSIQYFSAELVVIQTDAGSKTGEILTIKDITLFIEHEKQLETIAAAAMKQAESSEISFLQAQISPHFINNTLSIIASMISRDDAAAKDLVVDLSEYLINCYRADNASPMNSLEKELESVYTYVRIAKARFEERLNFTVTTDDLPHLYLPRLVLQPLVENAIRHGILTKIEGGTVRLNIHREGRFVCFEINDDGVGIEQKRIEALLNGRDDRQGVGIINLHKRLLNLYGEGLDIQSVQGETTVSFRVPITEAV